MYRLERCNSSGRFGNEMADWIGWFPTALVFLVVIAVLAVAVWIMG